jgi:hypothetical protein
VYSSLQTLDLVVDDPERGPTALQTDHRTPREINAEWELSILFAAVRARAALLCGRVQHVRFTFAERPPTPMVTFVQQCGAEVELGFEGERHPAALDLAAAAATVQDALLRLGSEVLAVRGLAVDLQGLEDLEALLRAESPRGPDDDELGYWTAVLQLGAAAAVVAHTQHGGTVHLDTDLAGSIPFRWSEGGALSNVFGRAATFLDDDPGVPPSKLVALMGGQQGADGDVMFNLRPPGWEGVGLALTVPLLPNLEQADPHQLPVVALVVDLPTATKTLAKNTPAAEIERLRASALENNRKHPVHVERVEVDGEPLLFVHGHYYAAERLLDPEFVRDLAAQLGTELLLAAVPKKGLLMVQRAAVSPERVAAFRNVVRGQLEGAQPTERLSPALLLAQADGSVVGVARFTEGPAQLPPPKPRPKKLGFWARWFGGDAES